MQVEGSLNVLSIRRLPHSYNVAVELVLNRNLMPGMLTVESRPARRSRLQLACVVAQEAARHLLQVVSQP
jgi:hypothetical protein